MEPQDALSPLLHLADRLPIPILVKAADGTIRFANAAYACLTGMPAETLIGRSVPDPCGELAMMAEEDRRALAGEVVTAERRGRPPLYSEEFVYRVIKTRLSELCGTELVLVIGVDLTPVRVAEGKLKHSELELRSVWEASLDGMSLSDDRGTILRVNAAYCRLTGCSREDIEGRLMEEVFDAGYRPRIAAQNEDAIRSSETVCAREEFLEFRNGTKGWFDITRTPLDIPGLPRRLLATFRDVSERRINTEQLSRSARLAQEAAGELESVNSSLRQANEEARRMAERADALNAARGDFLASMSHEIRTPLHGILGMTDLALKTALTPEQREYLELISSSGDSLLLLLNDILDHSKAEVGRMELELAPFSIRAMLESALRPLALRAAARNVLLRHEIEASVPDWVEGDSVRLRQVVLNVVGNAIKFTHQGSVDIHVDAADLDAQSVTLRVRVRDTGIGIPADKHKSIFLPFCQADASTSRRYGGAGLGLSICATLIQMMGGRIWMESDLGQGSTFWFTAVLRVAQDRPAPALLPRRSLRLLVAEDNLVSRSLITRLLERAGHRVVAVTSGADAVEHASTANFDVILMDLNMPELDGITAAREIRARAGTVPGPPILAITACHDAETRLEALAAGIDGFITKPFQEFELMHLLHSVVRAPVAEPGSGGGQPRLLDKAAALARAGGDAELLAEIAGLFLSEYPDALRKIREAIASGDARTAEREAHGIKGSVANFGAAEVVHAALAVESAARNGALPEASAGMHALEGLLERLRPELEALAAS